MPEPTRFRSAEEYYSTLFHEYAHSTGHSKRLDRKLDSDPKPFGSPDYGKEELVAEMAAAFLCGHAGITPTVIENQAAYVQGWLKTIKADKKLVIGAAGQAQRAADWIRNERSAPRPIDGAGGFWSGTNARANSLNSAERITGSEHRPEFPGRHGAGESSAMSMTACGSAPPPRGHDCRYTAPGRDGLIPAAPLQIQSPGPDRANRSRDVFLPTLPPASPARRACRRLRLLALASINASISLRTRR